MMAFNNNAITEADKRIAELEQQKRLLEQQNAQLVQEKTQREQLLRGELETEKNGKYESQGFSWDSLTPKEKGKNGEAVIPVAKMQEAVTHLVAQQFNSQLQASANKLQQEQQTQQLLLQKFQAEHPDLAGDPRVVELIAQDWAEARQLAGDRVPAEELYNRVVNRGKKYKNLLPPAPKNFNNPYAPSNPGGVPFGVSGATGNERQDMKETHRAEIQARKEALKARMLGGLGTPTP